MCGGALVIIFVGSYGKLRSYELQFQDQKKKLKIKKIMDMHLNQFTEEPSEKLEYGPYASCFVSTKRNAHWTMVPLNLIVSTKYIYIYIYKDCGVEGDKIRVLTGEYFPSNVVCSSSSCTSCIRIHQNIPTSKEEALHKQDKCYRCSPKCSLCSKKKDPSFDQKNRFVITDCKCSGCELCNYERGKTDRHKCICSVCNLYFKSYKRGEIYDRPLKDTGGSKFKKPRNQTKMNKSFHEFDVIDSPLIEIIDEVLTNNYPKPVNTTYHYLLKQARTKLPCVLGILILFSSFVSLT